jgi:hypothetical protein
MTRPIAVVVICLTASLATAAGDVHPLNAKTGLWQITETVTWTGLPPQMSAMMKNGRTINYKSCVREKDLNGNPFANGADEKCNWKVLKSSSTDMEVQGNSCELGKEFGMTADIHGTIHVPDPENGTGSFTVVLTGNGQTMNGHANYSGKWTSATCPADMN